MMARRRAAADESLAVAESAGVPPDLLRHKSPVWRDPRLFQKWVRDNLPTAPTARHTEVLGASWPHAFNFALTEWARANDLMVQGTRIPNTWPDYDKLARLGIFRVVALEQASAMRGADRSDEWYRSRGWPV